MYKPQLLNTMRQIPGNVGKLFRFAKDTCIEHNKHLTINHITEGYSEEFSMFNYAIQGGGKKQNFRAHMIRVCTNR